MESIVEPLPSDTCRHRLQNYSLANVDSKKIHVFKNHNKPFIKNVTDQVCSYFNLFFQFRCFRANIIISIPTWIGISYQLLWRVVIIRKKLLHTHTKKNNNLQLAVLWTGAYFMLEAIMCTRKTCTTNWNFTKWLWGIILQGFVHTSLNKKQGLLRTCKLNKLLNYNSIF